ncbi:Holliday junction branch migration protein RuvA [Sciscionella sediminilitoris]|uniref:Holliday junction branch migration protein RuvA n=1 Tax=Sciscionella sediminilitoris TaxID=1445613 RepID=UPI0004DF2C0F|nr:Holliday junction branch migration protein RuvA [Sciscionella sp. SE31]
MISQLRGTVVGIGLDSCVLDVGGVGYAILATPATLAVLRTGTEATLATSLVVREDSMTLYGFTDTEARDLFTLLQTVSGIGPRIALAMLAVLEPDALTTAIAEEDVRTLTTVPGIGRKGAERLVLELRDKVGAVRGANSAAQPASGGVRASVVEALTGLGFAVKQAESAVDKVLAQNEQPHENSAVLRGALTMLGRK